MLKWLPRKSPQKPLRMQPKLPKIPIPSQEAYIYEGPFQVNRALCQRCRVPRAEYMKCGG